MRAEDLRLEEVFIAHSQGGFPLFASSRMMVIGTRVLGQMQEDLINIMGKENGLSLLGMHGYESGVSAALAMKEKYDWDTEEEQFKAGISLRNFVGFAKEVISKMTFNLEDDVFYIEGTWEDSLEANQWIRQQGIHEDPICLILSGWASGYASACFGKEILVKEIECKAQGKPVCKFVGKPLQEWNIESQEVHRFWDRESLTGTMGRMHQQLVEAWKEVDIRRLEIQLLKSHLSATPSTEDLVFRSHRMAQVKSLAEKVAPTESAVLITGESGTGKEVLVRLIHHQSKRAAGSCLVVDCAALPENLLESELFGHVKGAFTGADRDKKGLFVEAGGGTLFLDEVGELPLPLQSKILRALQEKTVRPVGGVKEEAIHARVVAATNRDLGEMVKQGQFRSDLYYRLAVIPILMPPLRERKEDILPLARFFLEKFSPEHKGFSAGVIRLMESYSWPGNVRELENSIEHASVLSGGERIRSEHLPHSITVNDQNLLLDLAGDFPPEAELIQRYTDTVLMHTNGNQTKAAKILNIDKSTLWRRLNKAET